MAEEESSGSKIEEDSLGPLPAYSLVNDDGRVDVDLDSSLAKFLAAAADSHGKRLAEKQSESEIKQPPPPYTHKQWITSLNIVIQVVGSRGDVQPFVALGHELKQMGHRVRIATHETFRHFVQSSNLEFFSIGGDPAELMAFMVKNPGLIPDMKCLREGEIQKKRKLIRKMMNGCWDSCISPDPETHKPFVANAIIANPPSFAHIHCAQAMGIPLHLMFTMPWTPTRSFPHPLANLSPSSVGKGIANFVSYWFVQYLTWQGLADVTNNFRKRLDLEPIPLTEGPFLSETLNIPHTYCWSPSLIPKPSDWAEHIGNFLKLLMHENEWRLTESDVCGFFFRETPTFTPPVDLEKFLAAGPPPVYIGFGSIVVDDPEALTRTILQAIDICGVRAIVSSGWGSIGKNIDAANVFVLSGDCPHEWLFERVSAVVHHGGAGTTACGLSRGRPTAIVPFFGDQPFWGDMVAAAGAGPAPIPSRELNAQRLSDAIGFCLTKEAAKAAQSIADQIMGEDGVRSAVTSFHRHLSPEILACDILPHLPASWIWQKSSSKSLKISGIAAEILVRHGMIKWKNLEMYEILDPKDSFSSQYFRYMPNQIYIENQRWDPLTASASSLIGTSYDILEAGSSLWTGPIEVHRRAKDRGVDNPNSPGQIASMVGASAMSIPKIYGALLKALVVDVPLAITEGLRSSPRLYGERVEQHEHVSDWKSGGVVAGKVFVEGFRDGLSDLVVQPSKGLQEEGVIGMGKGIGKGMLGTVTKTGSAMTALLAYPSQGIYKSIHSLVNSGTRKAIMNARKEQELFFRNEQGGDFSTEDEEVVLRTFSKLQDQNRKR